MFITQKSRLRYFFRKLWSLSLVPHEDIVSTLEKIVEEAPTRVEDEEDDAGAGEQLNDGMSNFISYFERNWIRPPANKTRGDKAGQKRKAPIFTWSTWNHRSDILLGKEITSNQSESYNFSSKVSSCNYICSSVTSLSPLEA